MSRNSSTRLNDTEVNDVTFNLPPPGGGLLLRSSSDDDTTNGNSSNSNIDAIGHASNIIHSYPPDSLHNGDNQSLQSSSMSIAVGGARPKVKTFNTPKFPTSTFKETSSEHDVSIAPVNGYLKFMTVLDDDIYEDPPTYEAAMAMTNGANVLPISEKDINCRGMLNGNSSTTNGKGFGKHTYLRNPDDDDRLAIPNGNSIEHAVDNEEFSEATNNESDTDEDELNEEDELTADLPKSFYVLDVGSDSEGGNCTNQGVSRAGQSNLSSEVTKLLIQSEMVAQQQRIQNGTSRRRRNGTNLASKHTANDRPDLYNGRGRPSMETNGHLSTNGLVNAIDNDRPNGVDRHRNGNMTPDDEADFLEMDFEPNDSDASEDSGDSGRGADETTDGNDAIEDLDDFVHDHGFGAVGGILREMPNSVLSAHGASREVSNVTVNLNNPEDDLLKVFIDHANVNGNSDRQQKEIECQKTSELSLAVKTNINGSNHSTCIARSPSEPNPSTEKSEACARSTMPTSLYGNSKEEDGNLRLNDAGIQGVTSAPLQSPAGRVDINDELTTASLEAHEMSMVRSRSLNSSLSSTLRRAPNSLNTCIDSPCLLMKALARTVDHDTLPTDEVGDPSNQYIKRRHISENASTAATDELPDISPSVLAQNLPEYPRVDMEVCGARLSQREALVFGIPHNNSSAMDHNSIPPLNRNMRDISEQTNPLFKDIQGRPNLDPFQELSWISSTLTSSETEENSGDNDNQPDPQTEDDQQCTQFVEKCENAGIYCAERTFHTNATKIEKIMIWNEVEACKRQVNQVGVSACGATAVINVLQALDWSCNAEDVISVVPTRLRANNSAVAEYLLSRSRAGTNHEDLIDAVRKITNDQVIGKFFHMYPQRLLSDKNESKDANVDIYESGDLAHWLGSWIQKGKFSIYSYCRQKFRLRL